MNQSTDDSAFLQVLGQRLRLLRVRQGMTRRILAARSGVSERYISAVGAGTGNGSILLLRALAAALHVGLPALLEEEPGTGCRVCRDGAGLPLASCVDRVARGGEIEAGPPAGTTA